MERQKKFAGLLFWIALTGVGILAALYISAMLIAGKKDGLQITAMMGMEPGSEMAVYFGWFYASVLFATAIAGYGAGVFGPDWARGAAVFFAGGGFVMTLVPLGWGVGTGLEPARYEHFVGEILTCVALAVLALTAYRVKREGQK